jgi:hypothetical protein
MSGESAELKSKNREEKKMLVGRTAKTEGYAVRPPGEWRCWSSSRVNHRGIIRRREVHCAAWNDGRNRVLVDHLGHGVAQQHNVLVKRLNLALQLDAIDEINRHRHMLTAQSIEEWVLKKLPFVAHDILRVMKMLKKEGPYHSVTAAYA